MKKYLLILIFFIFSIGLYAQKQELIDSLNNELSLTKEDTSTVKLLNKIADEFKYSSPDSTFKYADIALQLSFDINYKLGKAKAYRLIGLSFSGRSEYEEALKYFFLSIKEAMNSGNDDFIAVVYTSVGIVYRKKSDYDEALKYYLKSLEILKKEGDPSHISSALNNVGIIYKMIGNNDKAIDYYSESLAICQKIGKRDGIAYALGNLGLIYKMKGELEKSVSFLNEALIVFEEYDLKNMIANVYTNLGEIYLLQKKYQESFNSIQKANKIYSETENNSGRAETYIILGNIYMNQKKYSAAESAFSLGLEISKKIGYKEYIIEGYYYLSKLDSAKRNFQQALVNYKKYIELKDSVFGIEKNKAISEIQGRYDLAEKERENILLRKNNEISDIKLRKQSTLTNFIRAFSALLVLIVFLVIFYWYREKRTNKLLFQKNNEIITQNAVLEKHKERIMSQFEEISLNNKELEKYKNHLEKLVDERTTKLHTALKEAKQSDELKTEFLMNLSHEIRTPINAISGFSEIIINDKEKFKIEHLTPIQKSMDDLVNTIDRLVIFSKLQVGGYQIKEGNINLSDFFENFKTKIAERQNILYKSDINLQYDIDYKVLPNHFYSDAYILENALIELIENAFKFTDKGQISLKVEALKGNLLCIRVVDTGMGIKKDAIPHIFDFLRKFDKDDKLFRGMGVGLALVKKSIEVLSGTITMNSIPYEGAEFIITIPEIKKT